MVNRRRSPESVARLVDRTAHPAQALDAGAAPPEPLPQTGKRLPDRGASDPSALRSLR